MEKIWIKKELYFSSYEFLKFLIFLDFHLIFNDLFIMKIVKKWVLFHRPRGADVAQTLTWHTRLTWRVGPARMRRGTQGHVAKPARPTCRAGGVSGRRPCGSTGVHADACVGTTWQRGWCVKVPRASGSS